MRQIGARTRSCAIGVALVALVLYFPGASAATEKAATTPPPAAHPTTGQSAVRKKPASVKRIDINRASKEELKTLPGIGDADADRIIAGRPFLTKADLVTKKVLPEGIYVSIRKQIVATQSGKPPRKK